MSSSDTRRYLLDVNVLYALVTGSHLHNSLVRGWFFASSSRRWDICAFTEAGLLRNLTASRPGKISMRDATAILAQLAEHPGYGYLPVTADWQTLCSPFFKRLFGTQQVTDAYLLGLAVHAGLVLVTLDKAILHLAGDEFSKHVLLLQETQVRAN